MRDTTVELHGRTVAYTDIGDPGGTPVLFFHGAPMSRRNLGDQHEEFGAAGLRVITPDRPGYGGSSPAPGRTLTDWAEDAAALADALRIDRFLVAAHSSGGPYGVVTAALLSERLLGTVVLGGVTDFSWEPAWEGYREDECTMMRLPDEKSALAWAEDNLGDRPSDLPAPDLELFATRHVPHLAAAAKDAFAQGVGGYAQDSWVQGRPWDFDPAAVKAPFLVAHGDQDTVVPLAHATHTAALVPGADLRVLPGHGHITVLWELPALLTELRDRR
ncbi:alpha/beta fold hydrolase [Nocardiopsis metallicus]|uniref:Pimeloyl-ACP methyl ester carboxylesterase n=1 Tax=Nocardiopsis metallicus TaxID=179819 RepID=A0A840W548_9ACTN|nr:alpha/beta hydrolase [Nocardiopsis metallicus]MBB5491192.1 pimeloyl-ACP methyl ester carboxylesterase [Nocardiopsis metallicus]